MQFSYVYLVTKRYNCTRLVWYEIHEDVRAAIQREKSLKRWYREWKIALVEKTNPSWRDLFFEMSGLVADEGGRYRSLSFPRSSGLADARLRMTVRVKV